TELYNTHHRPPPDGLSALPRDYAALRPGVPVLGPPLPGDLGRPMLAAGAVPTASGAEPDANHQQLTQEREAARTSRLFATAAAHPSSATSSMLSAAGRGA